MLTAVEIDKARRCEFIYSDSGRYLLGPETADEARAWLVAYDDPAAVEDVGWMHNVGWDRENYERKRDFVAESGYSSWWEGCRPPDNGKQTTKCKRAWAVTYVPASTDKGQPDA